MCAALVVACTRTGKGVVLDVVHKLLVRVHCPMPLNVILGVFRGCTFRARLRHLIVSSACVFPFDAPASCGMMKGSGLLVVVHINVEHAERCCGGRRQLSCKSGALFLRFTAPLLGTELHSSWKVSSAPCHVRQSHEQCFLVRTSAQKT